MECLDSRQLLAATIAEVPVWDEPDLELAPAAEIAWGASCPAILAPAIIAEHEARLEMILEAAFADAEPAVDGDAEAAFDELAPDVDEYSLLEGDFNGDGLTDLLFVSQNPEKTALVLDLRLANADGRWTFAQQVIPGVGEVDLQLLLVDNLNADGRDDLIFALSDLQNGGELRLYVVHSFGDGNWAPMQPVSEEDYVLEPAASTPAGDAALAELAAAHDSALEDSEPVIMVPVYVEVDEGLDDSAARLVMDFRPAIRDGATGLEWVALDGTGGIDELGGSSELADAGCRQSPLVDANGGQGRKRGGDAKRREFCPVQ